MAEGIDDFESRASHRVVELGDDLDLRTFAAMFDLFRVWARVAGDLETSVHRPLGLSIAGFRILFTVWVFESLEPRQLARLSGVSRAAVSGVLNTLERDGLATRTREAPDRRLVTVRVTTSGRARLAEAYRRQNRREQEIFGTLSAAELAQLTALMRKVLEYPEQSVEGASSERSGHPHSPRRHGE